MPRTRVMVESPYRFPDKDETRKRGFWLVRATSRVRPHAALWGKAALGSGTRVQPASHLGSRLHPVPSLCGSQAVSLRICHCVMWTPTPSNIIGNINPAVIKGALFPHGLSRESVPSVPEPLGLKNGQHDFNSSCIQARTS